MRATAVSSNGNQEVSPEEPWPGNHTDAKALVPAVERLRERFGIRKATVVADRGMMSKETVSDLEKRGLGYILGARMRSVNAGRFNARRGSGAMRREVKLDVLSSAGRYRDVADNLRVKDVTVDGRRYVVCLNPEEAEKPKVRSRCGSARETWDRAGREAILASLEDALKKGPKALVGNRGYRRYLAVERGAVSIDRAKAKDEARYPSAVPGTCLRACDSTHRQAAQAGDGKYVLRTNLALDAAEVAVKYKQLWRVERAFRTVKPALDTGPIYHRRDETIDQGRPALARLRADLSAGLPGRAGSRRRRRTVIPQALSEVEAFEGGSVYWLRTEFAGCASKVLSALGIAAPPTVRKADA